MPVQLTSPPDTLLAAIQNLWNNDATLIELAGQLYASEVPERDDEDNPNVLPYSYLELDRTSVEWTTNLKYIEYSTLDFHCLAEGAEATERASDQVKAVFDWATLPLRIAGSVFCQRLDYSVTSTNSRYKDQSIIYHAHLKYAAAVQRTLPTST